MSSNMRRMDYEHLFDEIEIIANPFALCELRGLADLNLEREAGATLHYVLAGEGEIQTHGRPPVRVGPGTLALIPSAHSHSLRSVKGSGYTLPQCRPVEMDLLDLKSGDRDDRSSGLLAICCHIDIGFRGTRGLINLLRTPIMKTAIESGFLLSSIEQMLTELSSPKLGSRAIVRAIILQCVIELFREKILDNDPKLRWMAVLKDDGLWAALRAMLDNPGEKHSVDSLAGISAMSRSAFAARFTSAYGTGPMELLRNLRMALGAQLLENPAIPIERIAQKTGFKSRSAFTRAFKAAMDISPQQYRQNCKN